MMEEPTIYEQQTNTQAKAIDLRAELAKLSATEGNLNGSSRQTKKNSTQKRL